MAELKSAKQEMFVQGLANGLSQRVAYRAAYPSSVKWKDSAVDVNASKLLSDTKVSLRLKELQAEATSKAVLSAAQRKEWLSRLIESPEEKTKDKLKAIDILNKMDGEYIEKVQVNGQVNNPFEGMTTEELKELIDNE